MPADERRIVLEALRQIADNASARDLPDEIDQVPAALRQRIERLRDNIAYIGPVVDSSLEDLPKLDDALLRIIDTTETSVNHLMQTSEQIMERLTQARELIGQIAQAEPAQRQGLFEQLQQLNAANQDEIFDMMSSLEFQDITHQIVDRLNKLVDNMCSRIEDLNQALSLHLDTAARSADPASASDKAKQDEPSATDSTDQGLVDKLLAEFGL